MILREANFADIAKILSLYEETKLIPTGETDLFANLLKEKIQKDPDLLVVAYDEERDILVGCIMGLYDPLASYTRLLAVNPVYRRKGIGILLRNEIVDRLKKRGAVFIGSLMYVSNRPIYGLLKKMGWTQLEDCHCFYIDTRS